MPPRRSPSACRSLLRRRGRRCVAPTIGLPPFLGDDDNDRRQTDNIREVVWCQNMKKRTREEVVGVMLGV